MKRTRIALDGPINEALQVAALAIGRKPTHIVEEILLRWLQDNAYMKPPSAAELAEIRRKLTSEGKKRKAA